MNNTVKESDMANVSKSLLTEALYLLRYEQWVIPENTVAIPITVCVFKMHFN
jgi:hypothetical protein